MKKAVICGASGFVGTHLTKRLKAEGYWVRGLDRRQPLWEDSEADEFLTVDLRHVVPSDWIFGGVDECYQLACEVGGLGYIMDRNNDAAMLRNSAQINLAVLEGCRYHSIPRVFFSSSACVYSSLQYPHQEVGLSYSRYDGCKESEVPPYDGDNEYAIEKFFGERLYAAYARNFGMQVRIARLHNTFGPYGEYDGGREKAPAAICRKIAKAEKVDTIDIWGNGLQTRSFMYADDCVEGIRRLMQSDFQGPVNIGSSEMVTVLDLVGAVSRVANKLIKTRTVDGPVGVSGRNSNNALIKEKLGWEPTTSLLEGVRKTYPWIEARMRARQALDETLPVV